MATVDATIGAESFSKLPEDDVRAFTDGCSGAVIAPADPAYDEARRVWNGTVDASPAMIVQCRGTADVVDAVTFAREHDLEVAVRAGGHNVAGTAVCDGGLVVDLSAMTGVRVDRQRKTVRVEAGATLGDVDRETQLFGLATPLGAVSETGVAGLTLNGGYGHLTPEYGLALDNVRSVDVVTADGTVRTASEDQHADLFWGIRGAGGAFGVVTSFEFDCHEVGPEVYALFPWFHGDEIAAGMDRFREWCEHSPRDASALAIAAHVPELEEFPEEAWGDPAIAFLGCYRGDPAAAETVFAPLLEIDASIVDLSGPMRFADLQSMLDEDFPDGMRYYWKSVYLEELTAEVVDLISRYTESAPSALSTVDVWHLEGAASEVTQDATAFWHRDKPYMLNFEANWEEPADDDRNAEWVREGIAEAQELSVASGRYGNFPGMTESRATELYGGNADRLVELKTTYDPENVFRGNGAIEPRSEE